MAFIVFEGIDACGKSTQIKELNKFLENQGVRVILTREPGGTPLAEDLRNLLLRKDGEAPVPRAELLLYTAGRAQHVDKVIKPALDDKFWVISDRYAASTMAFQAHGRNLEPQDINWLNSFATDKLWPDLYILLDVSVEVSRRRLKERAESKRAESAGRESGETDRMEEEKISFHEAVRRSYLQQSEEEPQRWLVIDGTQAVEEIFKEIIKEIKKRSWL